ncbi:hypothetical protein JCM8547_006002 [Rhodosporidiobolus lusitaniae]
MTAASTKRIVSLTQLDSAYDKISLCPSFVFALPPTWKEEDARMRVEQVKQASERVVHKWRVLAGRPVWTKAGVWAITVPDHFEALSTSRPLVGFTTTTIAKRYYEAAGLSTPLPSLSSRRSGFLPPPLHPLFRHHSVPTTLAKHASTGAPLVNIHLTLLLDAVCIGVSVPHGVLDGRGTGMLLSAMGAEMRGREWQAPPLPEVGEENPVGSALEKLNEDDGLPSTAVSGSLAPLKAERQPMTLLGLVRFFTNVFWQKIWWRSEQRWLFLRQQVVDRLAREVKEEVQKETEGREHVSTGDVLHAWLLKTLVPTMLLPLTHIDQALDVMALSSCFVFALPPSPDAEGRTALVARVKEAAERVVRKWKTLGGLPERSKDGVWAIHFPEDDDEQQFLTRSAVAFTTADHAKPFHEVAGLSAPLPPLSASPSFVLSRPPPLHLFRPSSVPSTLADHAKRASPLIHVHVALFSDSVGVGISVSHGVLDGTGLGIFNRALAAELHGQEWEVPLTLVDGENPFATRLRRLEADERIAQQVKATPPPSDEEAWSLFSIGAIARLILNGAWEKLWWKNEMREAFLRAETVERLVERVKGEVKAETGGKEFVSTSDILTGWLFKAIHSEEGNTTDEAIASSIYSTRALLDKSFPSEPSLARYPSTAAVPFMLQATPLFLSTLASTPVSAIALAFRRNLEAFRSLPSLSLTARWILHGPAPVMRKDWPQLPAFFRLFMPWTWLSSLFGRRKPHIHRCFFSGMLGLGTADLTIPSPQNEKEDLPFTFYYQAGIVPGGPDHLLAMQNVPGGITVCGSLRRSRWEALQRRVEELEREAQVASG